ncbi:MAG: hypothetical protein GXO43_06060 [Crenarchaeota archaeon]|nr:hypothetical protein [Thermoproteota archaeon]
MYEHVRLVRNGQLVLRRLVEKIVRHYDYCGVFLNEDTAVQILVEKGEEALDAVCTIIDTMIKYRGDR